MPAGVTCPEALLIARLKLQRLIDESRWDEAATVGTHCLRGAEQLGASAEGQQEATRIAIILSDMGMLVDTDLTSRFLCVAHVSGAASQPLVCEATEALKKLCGHDVEAWSRSLLEGGPICTLEGLEAAIQLLDVSTCQFVVQHRQFHAAIQKALCSAESTTRAAALQVLTSAVLTAPSLAVPLLPILIRAVFVEEPAIKQVALANVLDVASVLARLPPPPTMPAEGDEEEQADVAQQQQQQLESMMQWVPQLLYAPTLGMQTLAALGLSRIVLHRLDESLLCACADPEQIIAQLTRRYTACDVPAPAPGTDAAADPLPILLAFFEELKAKRQDDVGNTIAWMVLDALEGKTRLDEIDAAAHRCARFLFTLVDPSSASVVLDAVCLNVESELGVQVTSVDVAAWLGESTA